MPYEESSIVTSLIAGGIADLTVTTLFPLDTIKTRLQSPLGFWHSGGFHGLYKGIAPVLIISGPLGAVFFCSYNIIKRQLKCSHMVEVAEPVIIHMTSASIAEMVACLLKVPAEILKQRLQVGMYTSTIRNMCGIIYSSEGIRGFYRGLSPTILRDIPFVAIELPIWEFFNNRTGGYERGVFEMSMCGATASGVAAALTTPLDVVKTRVMLADKNVNRNLHVLHILSKVYGERGISGLFAGFIPRIAWISLGGAMFFGSYEVSKNMCDICSPMF